MQHPRSVRGFGFLSVLAALAIVALLYYGYVSVSSSGAASPTLQRAELTRDAAQSMACSMNRQALEKAALTWSISHPGEKATLHKLQQAGIPVPRCPENGTLTLQDGRVLCSKHP